MDAEPISSMANLVALGVVTVLFFAFAAVILLRERPESPPDTKRSSASWVGLALQLIGMGLTWMIYRSPIGSPMIAGRSELNFFLAAVAVVIAVASLWLAFAAVRELGKQWSLAARLVEGHKLITTGVYGVVRHPIYTAMLGMLLAAGLVVSHWSGVIAAIIVFYAGTKIRTVYEERLLSDAFGDEFAAWKNKVAPLIPFVNI